MRVVVTRIESDGTMHRRMVDTARQNHPQNWENLITRAFAVRPPYRPVAGADVYHIGIDGDTVQVGEYDLDGPLRDLVTVVLAVGRNPLGGTLDCPGTVAEPASPGTEPGGSAS